MSGPLTKSIVDLLPQEQGTFVGRIYDPAREKPVPVAYANSGFFDLSSYASTVSSLLELDDLAEIIGSVVQQGEPTWTASDVVSAYGMSEVRPSQTTLLAPIDLQVVKACGVTFAGSMIERVIEERAGGDVARADTIRAEVAASIGADIGNVKPGSEESARVKAALKEKGWWSQYLEVGLGPDPEVFTKAPVLSSVGTGDHIGIPRFSEWNNPEPELALLVTANGAIRGATLANDVNLRDVEGRSALLLGMAKDNNRSCAVGPLIRVFDDSFTIDDARSLQIHLKVTGSDGYVLDGLNSVDQLSRTFEELVAAALGDHHQYPDGFLLMTGTLFAPTEDRDEAGNGFTHKIGDQVEISSSAIGKLVNEVGQSEELPPWRYGLREFFADLSR